MQVPNFEASEAWSNVCVIGEQVCLICSPIVVVVVVVVGWRAGWM